MSSHPVASLNSTPSTGRDREADSEAPCPKGKLPAAAGSSIATSDSRLHRDEWDAGDHVRESQKQTEAGR